MSDDEREKYPSEEAERFQIRMPAGLRDRIKTAAADANRSMNAEIIATLEDKYPPPSLNFRTLVRFLDSIAGSSNVENAEEYVSLINEALSRTGTPYTVRTDGFGVVSFYPYASPKNDPDNDK